MTCVVPGCGRDDTRPYLRGALCPAHAPHVATPPPWPGAARPVAGTEQAGTPDPPPPPVLAPPSDQGAALAAQVRRAAARRRHLDRA